MSNTPLHPREILPHGAGLQLLQSAGELRDEQWEFITSLSPVSSVLSSLGSADAEIGLEIMAQAAGVALAQHRISEGNTYSKSLGFVGAVRGYEYSHTNFTSHQSIKVSVKVEMCDETVGICQCELFIDGERTPLQKVRITIIFSHGE